MSAAGPGEVLNGSRNEAEDGGAAGGGVGDHGGGTELFQDVMELAVASASEEERADRNLSDLTTSTTDSDNTDDDEVWYDA